MTEKEIQIYLEKISQNVELIQTRGGKKTTSLVNGILSGFGSVIGVALAVVIIGWVLNIVGVIPAFKNEAKRWENILQSSQNVKQNVTNSRGQ